MEKYIEQTEIILGIVQERMTEESFNHSSAASQRMYDFISKETADQELNVHELLNAVGTIFLASLSLAMESTKGEQE